MKLKTAHVQNYRSIDDSTVVRIEPTITCLVGKNESGKTSFLQALRRLNPTDTVTFEHTQDYPRPRATAYDRKHKSAPEVVVTGVFELEPHDIDDIEKEFGSGVVPDRTVTVTVDYANKRVVHFAVNEQRYVALMESRSGTDQAKAAAESTATVAEFLEKLRATADPTESLKALTKTVEVAASKPLESEIRLRFIEPRIPRFMYFDDYRIMAGSASLTTLEDANQLKSNPKLAVLSDLLTLAGTTPTALKDASNYESQTARLESAAISITDEVFAFWKQNTELEIVIDISDGTASDPEYARNGKVLRLRIRNTRHRVTVPFDERSRGFVWFFSFLASFNRLSQEGQPLILLLDEPGLNLHASAQGDFLRFIEERLGPHHQVVYTTHSPFLIDSYRLERVRTVEDVRGKGSRVSGEYLVTDAATAFPLQAALGYDLAQSLFVGPNCLLVEGPSDLVYLRAMSDALRKTGKTALDDRWVLTPVGGADKLATFVSLLGSNKLNVAVLMDFAKKDEQRVNNLMESELLKRSHVIRVSEFVGGRDADIEDLFDVERYLTWVKTAYPSASALTSAQLPPGARITHRVKAALAALRVDGFNHFAPSQPALHDLAINPPSEAELARFEAMFVRANSLLG